MLKGKTLIELTDVKTGKVEQFEDENIITNAAELYINALASLLSANDINSTNHKRFPIMKAAFGGIKLFENSIEENAANWQLPKLSVSKIVGYASNDATDGTDPFRGSANVQETTVLENGVQLVWDFATSEANGNISCVCLTSAYGGEYGRSLGRSGEYIYESSSLGYLIGYDKENDIWILLSNSSGNVKVRKAKICLTNLKLDEPFCVPTLIEESQSYVNFSGATAGELRILDANTLYCVQYASSTKLRLYYYDLETGSRTDKIIESSGVNFTNGGLIKQGYLYTRKNSSNGIYKINLTDTSDITLFEMPEATLNDLIAELPNGDLISGDAVFDPANGYYQTKAKTFTNYKEIIEKDGYLIATTPSYSNSRIAIMANELMLMSINNLDTPVTKTADKTMKITYTLTYTQ